MMGSLIPWIKVFKMPFVIHWSSICPPSHLSLLNLPWTSGWSQDGFLRIFLRRWKEHRQKFPILELRCSFPFVKELRCLFGLSMISGSTGQPTTERMNEQMNEWKNERMNKWTDEGMNKWTDEGINKWTNERTNKWTKMDKWMKEWMNKRINK